MKKINVLIAGATGYIGLQITKILANHKNVNIKYLCGSTSVGKKISYFDKSLTKKKLPKIIKFNKKLLNDVDAVLERLEIEGHFPKEAAGDIKQKIMAVVNHPKLKDLFLDDLHVFNEREILTTDGLSLRPDRIVISENEATIIDYKTGKPSPKHKEQIANYADILRDMDFTIKQSIIVYIDQEIDPIFV